MSRFTITLAIFFLAGLNFFWRLDSSRLEEWDETRRGVSAYEMLVSNKPSNFIAPTFNGELDYWASKPPLGLWLISASYKIFGANRFALRFPSALCALGTVMLLFVAGARRFSFPVGSGAALVLATTYPFLFEHAARNGEYDSPLTFLFTSVVLSCELKLSTVSKGMLLGFLCAGIFLLKSFAVCTVLLIVALWWIVKGKTAYGVTFWLSLAVACFVPIATWAALRYQIDGLRFFTAMFSQDFVGRTFSAIEGHEKGLLWYFRRVLKEAVPWSLLFPVVVLVLARRKKLRSFAQSHYLFIGWFFIPMVIATCIKTKIAWYVVPVYPALAFLLALAVYELRDVRWLGVIICVAVLIAETRILLRIHSLGEPRSEEVLLAQVPPGSIVASDSWSQVGLFHAKVERGLTTLVCNGQRECSEISVDFILTRVRAPSDSFSEVASSREWKLLRRENPQPKP